VKQKLLLLLKGAGLSLGLFFLWKPISQIYGFILNLLLSQFYPMYHMLGRNEQFPYLESLLLIPFAALTLVTPKISILKKAVTIGLMIAVFLLVDFIAIMFSADTLLKNPEAFITYRSLKMFAPFLIWLVVVSPSLFSARIAMRGGNSYVCPICNTEHQDIIGHLRETHGEKSLSKKKVKRYLSENFGYPA
jgi:hypothetical protein